MFSDPLVLLSFPSSGGTSVFEISSFFTPARTGFCVTVGTPFSSPRLPFEPSLDTASCKSDAPAGEYLPSPAALPPSPSDSEPEAELLSDGERDGDFFSCFSSFFLFFFFFLAACLLCFLDFASPSVSTRSERRKKCLFYYKNNNLGEKKKITSWFVSIYPTCDNILFTFLF